MALGTRSYARSYLGGGGLPPAIKALLIVNTALFLAVFFLRGSAAAVFTSLALTPADVIHNFAIWQIATYMFLHVGILSFVFNMLALYMFGKELEESWGTTRFLQFYFLCGCGAALFVILAASIFRSTGEPVISSVGAIYGILAASAALWPERDVLFIFFPMKMKWFVLLIAAIDFFVSFGSAGQIALLTGMLFGYFYVKSPSRTRRGRGPSPLESLKAQYQAWKIKRAKRKFQVYLRKQNARRDDIIN